MRVVIDPNVWISGLINPRGAPARAVAAVAGKRVTVVASQHLLDELATVLARPKFRRWITLGDAIEFVDALGRDSDLRPEPGDIPHRVRDPNDDYLAALADATAATIVTGDVDLLAAGLDPPAVTPLQLLDLLELS
ncbi:MAG: putative toxin-antitoxin system toxin component, PIN family [Nocardioidaceae bacterium]